jgi:histidinol-phosphate phosphatase family protein
MTKVIKDWGVDTSWTLFLDRDGVINERNFEGYITSPDHFVFRKDVLQALTIFDSLFNKKILVTNQQGISKGIMSKRNLNDVHRYMEQEIKTKLDFQFDAIFTATNLKGSENDRRKPNKAMALEAKELFPNIDFNKSIMIGDTDGDIKFGTNLGMKTVLVSSNEVVSEKSDVVVGSLIEFALMLKKI